MSTDSPGLKTLSQVRPALRTATHDLLGATIQVSDEDWARPSALPDWSRAELAAHIARHADALRGVVEGALRGEDVALYPSPEARDAGIRTGAGRTGLQIQEDLDTACGRLEQAFDEVTDWAVQVPFRDTRVPVATLPLGRLAEVVLHHIDLEIGTGFDDLDPVVAAVIMDWAVDRIGHKPGAPALRLVASDGRQWLTPAAEHAVPEPSTTAEQATAEPGTASGQQPGAVVEVSGTPQRLLGWLAGRLGADAVSGADEVEVPRW
ncbi:maleylpyruvate isomerase family mycothiol-dependent enzyme [Raineyella sp. LH-20]|uniref:maleylpyruvate isomerase family mycothiol-dependent enzyme n=1 Tax=Raineyella sp. LH-20 TaxID=3081204 RepID=UPI002952FB5F|nr:maleylpyruvate isomerase family mycothiol-dependent enzyme [Raineyella sp. LH-20]WOP17665.1 maleylpyruvate isomerase family mycothiol-dependent enzyme [Raineyella sp. LH-20]